MLAWSVATRYRRSAWNLRLVVFHAASCSILEVHGGFVPEGVGSRPDGEAMEEAAPFVLVHVPVVIALAITGHVSGPGFS